MEHCFLTSSGVVYPFHTHYKPQWVVQIYKNSEKSIIAQTALRSTVYLSVNDSKAGFRHTLLYWSKLIFPKFRPDYCWFVEIDIIVISDLLCHVLLMRDIIRASIYGGELSWWLIISTCTCTVGINKSLCSVLVGQSFDDLLIDWVSVFWHCFISIQLLLWFVLFCLVYNMLQSYVSNCSSLIRYTKQW